MVVFNADQPKILGCGRIMQVTCDELSVSVQFGFFHTNNGGGIYVTPAYHLRKCKAAALQLYALLTDNQTHC